MSQELTPRSAFEFEHSLSASLRETGRSVVEQAYNAAEPDAEQLPKRLRVGRREFRRNRKTCNEIATLFGTIQLRRCIYQAIEPGEPGWVPLERRLGVVARLATPALADEAARFNAELTQQQTVEALQRCHGMHWSHGSLRRVVAAMAQNYAPLRHAAQVDRVCELLRIAGKTRGKHAVTVSVGRDGVMVPTRPFWQEASTGTLSVLDRRGRRVGTVYVGRMPQPGQGTMTAQLLSLIRDVLERWQGKLPRLTYVTDAGSHAQDFYQYKLRFLKHPRTGEALKWEWTVDYYHACERITKLAEVIYGSGVEGSEWASCMRRKLRDERKGVSRVVRAAQALRRHRGLVGSRKEFDAAVAYLKKYASHMDYAGLRRRGLPIGSGVTEAACKTIFGHRFKQSGMRWKCEQAQHVLDLRVTLKSAVWDTCRSRWLDEGPAGETVDPATSVRPTHRIAENYALSA